MARETRTRETTTRQVPAEAPPEDPWAGDVVDEVELRDRQGRRWAVRPVDRGRYDYLGFGAGWWLVFWIVIAAIIVWWAWAWSW